MTVLSADQVVITGFSVTADGKIRIEYQVIVVSDFVVEDYNKMQDLAALKSLFEIALAPYASTFPVTLSNAYGTASESEPR